MLQWRKGTAGTAWRLALELFALALAAMVAQVLAPLVVAVADGGLTLWIASAVVGTLAVWLLLSAALLALERRPRLRWVPRLALLLHVAFWTSVGLATAPPGAPGSPEVVARLAWGEASSVRAGVGEASFALPPHATLAGWGNVPRRRLMPPMAGMGPLGRLGLALAARLPPDSRLRPHVFVRPSQAGEPLGARALLLAGEGAGAPPLAVLRLDLVVPDVALTRRILARTEGLGLTAATLLVAATHTHSGPGGYHHAPFAQVAGTDLLDASVRDAIEDAAVAALEAAAADLAPARLGVARTRDRDAGGELILAEGRRGDSEAVDDEVVALVVRPPEGPAIRAVLLVHGVHPTLRRRRHMAFDRDLVGAVEDALAATLPGRPTVLFVQGALGDVAPRAPRDVDIPPDTDVRHLLAERFAAAIADDLGTALSHGRARLAVARVELPLGEAHLMLCVGDREAFARRVVPHRLETDASGLLASLLALPANVLLWNLTLTDLRAGLTFDGAAGLVVRLDDGVGRGRHAMGAAHLRLLGADGAVADELLLTWQGGEPTTALARRWRLRAAAAGLPDPVVVSLVGDPLAYLTTQDEHAAGGYEALACVHGPEAGRAVGDALLAAARAAVEAAAAEDR